MDPHVRKVLVAHESEFLELQAFRIAVLQVLEDLAAAQPQFSKILGRVHELTKEAKRQALEDLGKTHPSIVAEFDRLDALLGRDPEPPEDHRNRLQ